MIEYLRRDLLVNREQLGQVDGGVEQGRASARRRSLRVKEVVAEIGTAAAKMSKQGEVG